SFDSGPAVGATTRSARGARSAGKVTQVGEQKKKAAAAEEDAPPAPVPPASIYIKERKPPPQPAPVAAATHHAVAAAASTPPAAGADVDAPSGSDAASGATAQAAASKPRRSIAEGSEKGTLHAVLEPTVPIRFESGAAAGEKDNENNNEDHGGGEDADSITGDDEKSSVSTTLLPPVVGAEPAPSHHVAAAAATHAAHAAAPHHAASGSSFASAFPTSLASHRPPLDSDAMSTTSSVGSSSFYAKFKQQMEDKKGEGGMGRRRVGGAMSGGRKAGVGVGGRSAGPRRIGAQAAQAAAETRANAAVAAGVGGQNWGHGIALGVVGKPAANTHKLPSLTFAPQPDAKHGASSSIQQQQQATLPALPGSEVGDKGGRSKFAHFGAGKDTIALPSLMSDKQKPNPTGPPGGGGGGGAGSTVLPSLSGKSENWKAKYGGAARLEPGR
ncbi:hypothetical protein BDK51DRAFT_26669, partial [Blyttiomyces helicus]